MSFLNNLETFGLPTPKPKWNRAIDPLKRMKESFIKRVREQIEILAAGNQCDRRSWVKCSADPLTGATSFIVSLRNGTKTMPLSGQTTHLEMKSEDLLRQFFERAIEACEGGELDQLLIDTMQKPRLKGGV